jgi:F5/8 type C domain
MYWGRAVIGGVFWALILFVLIPSDAFAATTNPVVDSSASSVYNPTWVAANAFDGNSATMWGSASGLPAWVQADLGSPVPVSTYTVTPCGCSEDPTAWTFSGSVDGASGWVELDQRTGVSGVTSFSFTNTALYRYYRLNVTSAGSLVEIKEITIGDGSTGPAPTTAPPTTPAPGATFAHAGTDADPLIVAFPDAMYAAMLLIGALVVFFGGALLVSTWGQ